MESNRFFIFVNRFNAIALMLVLIGSLTTISYFNVMSTNWRERRAVTVNESPGSNKKVELVFGGFERVKGSQNSFVELREKERGSSYGSGGGYGATRNVLFFTKGKITPTWLFQKNGYRINDVTQLKAEEYSEKESAIAIMYDIVYEDSDGNGKLDDNDKLSVAISRTDGSELKNIISSAGAVIDHQVSEDKKYLEVIYQGGQKVYMERFSLETFESISKSEITQIEKNN